MVFVETPPFERVRENYLDDSQYRLLQAALWARPTLGNVMRGSGGVRKMRWATEHAGKRGGLRVLYYWAVRHDHIVLLTVYHKSEMSDLAPKDIKALRMLVKALED
ncbi:MAG: type II toxin-antitoxin system RelE/ParE family toxin [Gammaproteobacteria bacterium]|nr:type II toxin-antitoxin system RelE/ParE family toxin [Gammaproteobacteria bacterium]